MSTHRTQFIKRHNLDTSKSMSISQISKVSKIPVSILNEVRDRGVGAWKTNGAEARKRGMGKEQWSYARIFAFVNKIEKGTKLNHDTDLASKIKK